MIFGNIDPKKLKASGLTLEEEADRLSWARYYAEQDQNDDRLKEIQGKVEPPKIGGYAAICTQYVEDHSAGDIRDVRYIFLGLFESKADASAALRDAKDKHDGCVQPVTARLAHEIREGKSNLPTHPEYFKEMSCRIENAVVAAAPLEDRMVVMPSPEIENQKVKAQYTAANEKRGRDINERGKSGVKTRSRGGRSR